MLKKSSLFGVPVLLGNKGELQKTAESCLPRHGILHTVNPVMLSYAWTNKRFRRILRDGVNFPDGVGVKAAFFLLGEKTDVLPGIEMAEGLFQKAEKICFFGGAAGVANRAFSALCRKYNINKDAFFFDGFTTKKQDVTSALRERKPDLVLVALGTPRQEIVIQTLFDQYPNALFVGVGGAFDVWAGDKKRAPTVFRSLGLEWLYRLLKEPKRIKALPRLLLFSVISSVNALRRLFASRKKLSRSAQNKNIVKN